MSLGRRLISIGEAEEVQLFKTVLYTGSGTTQSITGVGFQPDFVWIKNRDSSSGHALYDSVRGINKRLVSSGTNAEISNSSFPSFDSDGFSLATNDTSSNANGDDFVAWCWKGGGDDVLNEEGTIDSQVSANTDAGFSIVKFDGYQSSGATVGHGLNQTPELIIVKNLDQTTSCPVWFDDAITMTSTTFTLENSTKYLALDSTTSYISYTFDRQFGGTLNGGSGDEMIAYCFHSVSGYSKIGSYTGGGTSDVVVTTGFKPQFIMTKRTDNTGNWIIFDSKRSTSDTDFDNFIYPNLSDAEIPNVDAITVSDTGFTVTRDNAAPNFSGANYIYMAFK